MTILAVHDWFDVVRVINMVLSFTLAVLLVERAVRLWHVYDAIMRDVWWALFMWNMGALLSTAEVLAPVDTELRVFVVTFAVLLTFMVVLRNRALMSGGKKWGGQDL